MALETLYSITPTSTRCMVVDGTEHVLELFRRHTEIVWRVQVLAEGAPETPVYAHLKASSWHSVRAVVADAEALRDG